MKNKKVTFPHRVADLGLQPLINLFLTMGLICNTGQEDHCEY
jgi:hypothetical protein